MRDNSTHIVRTRRTPESPCSHLRTRLSTLSLLQNSVLAIRESLFDRLRPLSTTVLAVRVTGHRGRPSPESQHEDHPRRSTSQRERHTKGFLFISIGY